MVASAKSSSVMGYWTDVGAENVKVFFVHTFLVQRREIYVSDASFFFFLFFCHSGRITHWPYVQYGYLRHFDLQQVQRVNSQMARSRPNRRESRTGTLFTSRTSVRITQLSSVFSYTSPQLIL